MNRKRTSKLSLSRETIRNLENPDLRYAAGGSGQIGCPNTLARTCHCDTRQITCVSCRINSCEPTCTETA